MNEVVVRLTGDRIKVKGGEYVRDLVRCGECKWAEVCSQNVAMREPYDIYEKIEYCSYGERASDDRI